MKKRILYTLSFCVLLIVVLHGVNQILYEKQHFGTAKNIANETRDQIDVFFVGASHIFYGVNPLELWEQEGIAAYNLTTQRQPLWASRLLLQYGLRYQKPRVVVLDVIMATNFSKALIGTEEGTNMTHLALDPQPLSAQKMNGVLTTEQIDQKGELIFPIILNHTRLQQGLLSYQDFNFPWQHQGHLMKGYNFTMNILSYERPAEVIDQTHALPEELERSLRDFIAYCQDENLPLLLIKTPVISDTEMYQQLNRIAEIAAEYDVPFIDFNHKYDELDMDFRLNFADKGHLNVGGAEKVSSWLAKYLKENYDLPDHRGDSAYVSWELGTMHYHNLIDLRVENDLETYLSRADDPNMLTILAGGGTKEGNLCYSETLKEQAAALGLKKFPNCAGDSAYIAVLDGRGVRWEEASSTEALDYTFKLDDTRFFVHSRNQMPEGEEPIANINIGSDGRGAYSPSLLVMTFDKDTAEMIDCVRFETIESFSAFRDFETQE